MNNDLKTTIKIAEEVNNLLAKKFQHLGQHGIHYKKHAEIVTDADLLTNKYITKELLKNFPDYDIVSEEAITINNPGTKTWYVDPLDGTTNFAYGFPLFATCLGLEDKGKILIGVIGLPMMKQIFYAEKNQGAWCNKKKIKVSGLKKMKDAMILVCRGHSPAGRNRYNKFWDKFVLTETQHTRHFASAGVELSAVASGQVAGCVMAEIHPWDVLAGVILIREAGGRVTNWQGIEWQMTDKTMVASNGLIHNEITKLTKGIK
jgi:myo-inositol-1(or 4)-monophosphatase